MDLSFFTSYLNVAIFGICLVLGFVVKNAFDKIPNKYIPLMVTILGLVLAIVTNVNNLSLEVILMGMFSGLASTGCYELFNKLYIKKEE